MRRACEYVYIYIYFYFSDPTQRRYIQPLKPNFIKSNAFDEKGTKANTFGTNKRENERDRKSRNPVFESWRENLLL